MDDRDMIEVGGDTGDWERDRRTVSRTELIGIMRPRVEEILEEVRAHLDAAGSDHLPSQQIVLTGGSSQIPVLTVWQAGYLVNKCDWGDHCASIVSRRPIPGPAVLRLLDWSLFAAHPQDEWWDFEIPVERYPTRSLKRAVRWFKENW